MAKTTTLYGVAWKPKGSSEWDRVTLIPGADQEKAQRVADSWSYHLSCLNEVAALATITISEPDGEGL